MDLFNILAFLSFPIIFTITIFNITYLFKRINISEIITDSLIFCLFIVFLIIVLNTNAREWNEPLIDYIEFGFLDYYTPISFKYINTFIIFYLVGIISFFTLRIDIIKLPPIIAIFTISGVLIGVILSFFVTIQLMFNSEKEFILFNFDSISFLSIFSINFILCCVRVIKNTIIKYAKYIKEEKIEYKNKILYYCYLIISKVSGWITLSIIFIVPILCILLIILIAFGQQPDYIIRAFFETADWGFSKMTPPPPLKTEYHYLCTVALALRGHRKIVKPIRAGIRHGDKIIVNRQLCVANAFEDLLKERFPKLHKVIRVFYDKYGYPISKHIKTKIQADIVYILMKPLGYIFLIVLYTFDSKPENRIAIQYTK